MPVVIYMCMWNCDFGSRTLASVLDGQPSQISHRGKKVRASTNGPTEKEGNVASLPWAREQDGPLRISIENTLVA
jgi:hypothetical protein